LFVNRRRGSSGHLEWRIRLFGVGAIVGLAGMYAQVRWMIWIALVVLVVGFLLRFFPASGTEEDSTDGDDSVA
jgi:disulfide bond formation protein DsbB